MSRRPIFVPAYAAPVIAHRIWWGGRQLSVYCRGEEERACSVPRLQSWTQKISWFVAQVRPFREEHSRPNRATVSRAAQSRLSLGPTCRGGDATINKRRGIQDRIFFMPFQVQSRHTPACPQLSGCGKGDLQPITMAGTDLARCAGTTWGVDLRGEGTCRARFILILQESGRAGERHNRQGIALKTAV